MTQYVVLVVFPFAMIFAAFSDLLTMTIQNRVSILLAVAFPILAVMIGMPLEVIGLHLLTGFLCLAVTFGLFAAGWIGGGDAKLMAATVLWFGPTDLLMQYLTVAALLGGALTLTLLVGRARLAPFTGIDFVDRLLRNDTGVPYGIALGAAGLITYSASPWMDFALKG